MDQDRCDPDKPQEAKNGKKGRVVFCRTGSTDGAEPHTPKAWRSLIPCRAVQAKQRGQGRRNRNRNRERARRKRDARWPDGAMARV